MTHAPSLPCGVCARERIAPSLLEAAQLPSGAVLIFLVSILAAPLSTLLVPAAASARPSRCGPKSVKKIKLMNRDALDEMDRWNMDKARRKLEDGRLVASGRGCTKHPEYAQSLVILGVLEARLKRWAPMREAWIRALRIDPGAVVPKRALSPKVNRLFSRVQRWVAAHPPRRRAGGGASEHGNERPGPDRARPGRQPDPRRTGARNPATRSTRPKPRPKPPEAFEHRAPDRWKKGKPFVALARVPEDLDVREIKLYYRAHGEKSYRELAFKKGGPDRWSWVTTVPGIRLYVDRLQYYLVAYGPKNRPVSASGNSFQPHVIELQQ